MTSPSWLARRPTPASVRPRLHRVQVDRIHFDVDEDAPLARRLLELAGKTPADQFALYEKPLGGQPRRLPLDEPVVLDRYPSSPRYITLPLDQTEGAVEA